MVNEFYPGYIQFQAYAGCWLPDGVWLVKLFFYVDGFVGTGGRYAGVVRKAMV